MQRRICATVGPVGLAILALVVALALQPAPAEAVTRNFTATLDEAQALSLCNPNPAPANGGGSGVVVYDTVTNQLSWSITFLNLSGAAIAAHFHGPAAPGQNAGIQVSIDDLTSPSQGSAMITETQEADLLAGLYYVNYHTNACPSGEIRGQVLEAQVGGIAELPDVDTTPLEQPRPSDSDAGLWIALAAGATVVASALGGAAWYARRRWDR